MERAGHQPPQVIVLPQRTLVVLCGAAGSGKSTFAQLLVTSHQSLALKDTSIVSSDYCRALVCDDETNQQVNRDSFDLFHYIIYKRMLQGCFTIADSTALQAEARLRLLEQARRHNYYTCLFVFNIPPETCIQQDLTRQRVVGAQVINYHTSQLQHALSDISREHWQQVHVIVGPDFRAIYTNITIEKTSNLR